MLQRLLVDNLVIFESTEAEFGPGLVVITGETGAGKTLLVSSLRLLLGERADPALIGPLRDDAYVEASFEHAVPAALAELVDQGEELVLARRLRREGPSRALASGRACSASQLAEAGAELVSLTGQHAARLLATARYQLDLLDRFAKLDLPLKQTAAAFRSWRESEQKLERVRSALDEGERRLEMIKADLAAIELVAPLPGEEEELSAERERLRHSDALREAASLVRESLSGEGGAADALAAAASALGPVSERDPGLDEMAAELSLALETVSELAARSRSLAETYESDPGRLEEVEERLVALSGIRRRFRGLGFEEILIRQAELEAQRAELAGGEDLVSSLARDVELREGEYREAASGLRARRRRAAKKLSGKVHGHLKDLGLDGACFSVEIESAEPGPRGQDSIRMLLAANKGLPATALDKGVSGGELSRVNLALLLASEEGDDHPTYIFDEVDAGIGGQTAHIVALKLKQLSANAQVVVITHLAQLALLADQHLVIEKTSAGAGLRDLKSETERQAEIARLVGASGSEAGDQAAQMLEEARKGLAA